MGLLLFWDLKYREWGWAETKNRYPCPGQTVTQKTGHAANLRELGEQRGNTMSTGYWDFSVASLSFSVLVPSPGDKRRRVVWQLGQPSEASWECLSLPVSSGEQLAALVKHRPAGRAVGQVKPRLWA